MVKYLIYFAIVIVAIIIIAIAYDYFRDFTETEEVEILSYMFAAEMIIRNKVNTQNENIICYFLYKDMRKNLPHIADRLLYIDVVNYYEQLKDVKNEINKSKSEG